MIVPGGKVVGVRVLFTVTVSLLRRPFINTLLTTASNGRWPPLCLMTSTEFNHYKHNIDKTVLTMNSVRSICNNSNSLHAICPLQALIFKSMIHTYWNQYASEYCYGLHQFILWIFLWRPHPPRNWFRDCLCTCTYHNCIVVSTTKPQYNTFICLPIPADKEISLIPHPAYEVS